MSSLTQDPILSHLTTFGGHPLSCAASAAALDIITQESLHKNASIRGEKIKKNLAGHPAIAEVRGRGLMMAVELKNPDKLLPAVKACRAEGLLVDWFLFNDRSLRLAPPIIISDEETDLLCERLSAALHKL